MADIYIYVFVIVVHPFNSVSVTLNTRFCFSSFYSDYPNKRMKLQPNKQQQRKNRNIVGRSTSYGYVHKEREREELHNNW